METINFGTTKLNTLLHVAKMKWVMHEAASSDRAQRGSRRVQAERETGPIG